MACKRSSVRFRYSPLALTGLKIFDILVQAKQNEEAQGCGLVFRESENEGKESKGAWWMPRLTEAMKDVISCDKPRLGANDP